MRSAKPIIAPPYRLSFVERKEFYHQVEQFQRSGVMEDSQSIFAAPAVLVKKPRDQYHKVDYRKLIENMEPDKFTLPRAYTMFDTLGAVDYFSTMDIIKSNFFPKTYTSRG